MKQILDVGAEGIIYPWISSRAECEAAISAARYPPEGIRGWGPRRASRVLAPPEEYARCANDEVMVQVLNFTQADVQVRRGDRLAQGIVLPAPRVTWEDVPAIRSATRGGFGATG